MSDHGERRDTDASDGFERLLARQDDLEGKLFSQEHRVTHIWWNYWSREFRSRSRSEQDGIRRAWWWWVAGLFIPVSTSSASVGFIAVASLVVAICAIVISYRQAREMEKQTTLIGESNELARSALLVSTFDGRIDDLEKELLSQAARVPLADDLERKIVNWSNALQPYPLPDSNVPLSPERGRLLIALVDSPANSLRAIGSANFTRADLRNARFQSPTPNLSDAFLEEADLSHAVLTSAILREAFLHKANLEGALLDSADLSDSDLQDANLKNADLRSALLSGAYMEDADLTGAIVERLDWIDGQLSLTPPPTGLNRDQWRIVPATPTTFRLESINAP